MVARAATGGSFPYSTVPRPEKYQNTNKALDWGTRESCNRIVSVYAFTSLPPFPIRSRGRCRSTPLRVSCCSGGWYTSWWHTVLMHFLSAVLMPCCILSPSKGDKNGYCRQPSTGGGASNSGLTVGYLPKGRPLLNHPASMWGWNLAPSSTAINSCILIHTKWSSKELMITSRLHQ